MIVDGGLTARGGSRALNGSIDSVFVRPRLSQYTRAFGLM